MVTNRPMRRAELQRTHMRWKLARPSFPALNTAKLSCKAPPSENIMHRRNRNLDSFSRLEDYGKLG